MEENEDLMPPNVRLGFVLAATVLLAPACNRSRPNATASASLAERAVETQQLERQVEALKRALVDAQKGALFSPDHLAIGASEEVAQALIARALPIEKEIAGRFQSRIERATVSFRSLQASVVLEGRVSHKEDGETFADLKLFGGIPTIEVDPGGRTLRADIVLDSFQVTRAAAAGAEHALVTMVARELGERGLDALRALVPPLRLPVALEQAISMPGVTEGPVAIQGGELPLRASVARVLPISGRLWAMVDVKDDGWRTAGPSGGARP
jgi:hypothetical protein